MPTPAYIDLTLYLPLGGVNGFELNGFAVNGFGFVESPFAGSTFALDPYRSILEGEPQEANLCAVLPSVLAADPNFSVQVSGDDPSEVWAARISVEVTPERVGSELAAEVVSLADEVDSVSIVPAEYRTAYVLATHGSTTSGDRTDSNLDQLPPSQEPDEEEISTVPAEDRTSKVRRI